LNSLSDSSNNQSYLAIASATSSSHSKSFFGVLGLNEVARMNDRQVAIKYILS